MSEHIKQILDSVDVDASDFDESEAKTGVWKRPTPNELTQALQGIGIDPIKCSNVGK